MRSYVAVTDPAQGLAVWCWVGPTVTAEQWAAHLDDMRALREWSHLRCRPSVIIHMADSLWTPNAVQRRDIARESAHPEYRPNLAVVTRSPFVRGVIQTFSWLQKSRPYRIDVFPELATAIRWLEDDRGKPLPSLLDLLAEAHRELDVDPQLLREARDRLSVLGEREP